MPTSALVRRHPPGGDFLDAQKVTKDAVKGRVFRLPLPLTNPTRNDQTRRRKLHSVRFRLTAKAHLFRCGSFPNGNGRFRWGRTSNEGERMFAVQADGADRSL